MKTGTWAALGLAAVVLFYFANIGVAGEVLQYYILSVDFTGISSGRIVLMVQNPSNASININSMAGTITVNNTTIGNISNFQGGVLVPPNQQVPVQINVALNFGAVLSSLFLILTKPTGANPTDFVIQGNANINGGTIIPFNISQTVNV